MGEGFTGPEPDDKLVDLVEACLKDIESGKALDAQRLRASAGDLWDELQACLEVVLDLETVKRILDDSNPVEPLPERVGRFHVLRLLGRGGFARVFLGFDPTLGRTVAIKVMEDARRGASTVSDWIVREANSLAQIEHPGVLRVHELGEIEGHKFVVTEYVSGPSLGRLLEIMTSEPAADGSYPAIEAPTARETSTALALKPLRMRVTVVRHLARALEACHAVGVIHRDVKPENVLMPHADRPKLIDFGLSHLSLQPESLGVTEGLIGTERYLAPEQRRLGRTGASERSDLYSLGIVLCELLLLRRPTDVGERAEHGLQPIQASLPLRKLDGALPPELEWITERALEPNPDDRYPTMAAFADDLDAFLEHRRPTVGPRSTARNVQRFLARHRGRILVALGAGLLVMAFIGGLGTVSHANERHRVLSLLEETTSTVPRVTTARAASELLDNLDSLDQRAAGLDGRWSSSFTSTRVADDVIAARVLLAERCEELVEQATAAALAPIRRLAREIAVKQVYDDWSGPLGRAKAAGRTTVCATTIEGLVRLTRMGRGLVPEETQVEDTANLGAGYYRATAAGDRVLEFIVLPNQLCLQLTPSPLDEAVRSNMTRVEPEASAWAESRDARTPGAFLLSKADLNLRDIAQAFGGELPLEIVGVLTDGGAPLELDRAYGLIWDHAHTAAVRAGARLPTAAELWEAQRLGLLTARRDGDGEWPIYWCSTTEIQNVDQHFLYEVRSELPSIEELESGQIGPSMSRIVTHPMARINPKSRVRFAK